MGYVGNEKASATSHMRAFTGWRNGEDSGASVVFPFVLDDVMYSCVYCALLHRWLNFCSQ
jgi:hypothetical protein